TIFVFLFVIVLGLSITGVIPIRGFIGGVTHSRLTPEAKTVLTTWLETQEQEDASHYTFSLLEEAGDRTTYLVECKTEYTGECKYNILFVELSKKTGEVTNVEFPY
ncbi:MAG: hypothetical protein V1760_00525, partial [Candidatus Peregrinibacteria bacterium]